MTLKPPMNAPLNQGPYKLATLMGIGMMGLSLLLTAMLITGMFSGIYSYASIVIIAMLLAVGAIITYGGIEILKAGTYWQNTIDST